MSRFRMVALGAALMLGMGTVAGAQGRAAGTATDRAAARDLAAGPLFRGITLTDAQKVQLRSVGAKYDTLRQEMRRETRAARGGEGRAGAARANGARGDRQRPDSASMARVAELTQRQQADFRAVLTAEQQRTFDQNVAQLRERAAQRGAGEGRQRARPGKVGRRTI